MTRKYTYGFVGALAAALLLALLTGYLLFFTGDYAGRFSKEMLKSSDRLLLSRGRGEYSAMLGEISEEYSATAEYRTVLAAKREGRRAGYTEKEMEEILQSMSLSEEEAEKRLELLSYCRERLSYALGYPEYITGIAAEAEKMSLVSIFGADLQRNIQKTENDFYGLERLSVSAEQDEGLKRLLGSAAGDIFALTAAVLCAVFFAQRCRSAATVKTRLPLFALVFLGGVLLIFAAEALLADGSLSLGQRGRPIQSAEMFQSCPYIMSVETLLVLRTLFRALVCLTLFLLTSGALTCGHRKTALAVSGAALAADAFLCLSGSEISLFGALHAENTLAGYKNIFILGKTVNPAILLSVYLLVILAAAAIFAARSAAGASLLAKEKAEREYFDEIDKRYNEARLIRHDIKNHLAAVAMLMDNGDAEGARRYLGDISAQLDEIRPPAKTGSTVLDALLFRKMTSAKERGISVALDISVILGGGKMTDYDLCGIFSNLLDNAIEACEKLPEAERSVSLKVKRQLDMICIFSENKYAEICPENGGFSTTKPDKQSHGLGLKRIERIAAKYGGSVDVSAENGVFSISILLINQEI